MFCLGSPVTRFVHSNPLFAYVEDKEEASDRLLAVEALPETDTKLKDLHLLFTKGPMTIRGPLFQETHFDELVVLAHIRGLISIHQLGTAFYFKSAVDHYGLSRLTVCDNLPPSYTPPNKLEAFTSQTMTTLQMLLKNQPASERFCLLTPITLQSITTG